MDKKEYLKPYVETTLFNASADVLLSSIGDNGSQEDNFVSDPFAPVTGGDND